MARVLSGLAVADFKERVRGDAGRRRGPGIRGGAPYLPLWYTVANGLPVFGFMGAIRVERQPAGLPPGVVLAVAAVLVAVVFLSGAARRLSRD
ncbi:hypothetical protein AB0B15_20500 [Streptomyces sp. NPDC045456]|uniref:hypothetical protein n=1 Tax=Streptomyces sp. NPDC045456 TaxID=3155254 RepID=UPI0033FEE266